MRYLKERVKSKQFLIQNKGKVSLFDPAITKSADSIPVAYFENSVCVVSLIDGKYVMLIIDDRISHRQRRTGLTRSRHDSSTGDA
jgi:hypothetical protein